MILHKIKAYVCFACNKYLNGQITRGIDLGNVAEVWYYIRQSLLQMMCHKDIHARQFSKMAIGVAPQRVASVSRGEK
jgi:hypothetical protein